MCEVCVGGRLSRILLMMKAETGSFLWQKHNDFKMLFLFHMQSNRFD